MAGWAGLPAAVILVCSTGGATYVANKGGEYVDDGRPAAMTKLGVVTGVVALVFWLWATLLTIFKEFDLGMVSFALAIAASAYGVGVLTLGLWSPAWLPAAMLGLGVLSAVMLESQQGGRGGASRPCATPLGVGRSTKRAQNI